MKKILAGIACLFIAGSVYAQGELPNTTVKDLKTGKKLAFNQLPEKGKVTVINFWASWCVPCKKEIKNVCQQMATWKKEVDFNYFTMSEDESKSEGLARSYAISQGWDFPAYIDPNGDLKRSLNFENVPFTLIIDKTGKVAFMHTGYEEGSEAEVLAKVKELAKQ